ncbi:hypothetical protein Nepgr_008672 [Nepenthes gracilis]|uniref:MADS-box domain-containing protein n=1 Tax=Nepenthes gracilis TaxID=150966 RepID=A0AAD3S9C1_NEPGR|nr:hypothetical protein Nepgr_008672 [Nepenthes gracilis]
MPSAFQPIPSPINATGAGYQKMKHSSKGRRKIPIAPIRDKNKKHVTFSKRRSGLFKKASELCVLCSAEVAIITFSEAGKAFCFGHPTADAVIKRYLHVKSLSSSTPMSELEKPSGDIDKDYAVAVYKHNVEYEHAQKPIIQKNSDDGNPSKNNIRTNNGEFWWEEAVDKLDLNELERLMASLEDLRNNVALKVEELIAMGDNNNDQIGWMNQIDPNMDHGGDEVPKSTNYGVINHHGLINNFGFGNYLMPIMDNGVEAVGNLNSLCHGSFSHGCKALQKFGQALLLKLKPLHFETRTPYLPALEKQEKEAFVEHHPDLILVNHQCEDIDNQEKIHKFALCGHVCWPQVICHNVELELLAEVGNQDVAESMFAEVEVVGSSSKEPYLSDKGGNQYAYCL